MNKLMNLGYKSSITLYQRDIRKAMKKLRMYNRLIKKKIQILKTYV